MMQNGRINQRSAQEVAVDVQQLIRCQIARSIHYTSTIIVRLPEEANNQAQSLLVLVLLL